MHAEAAPPVLRLSGVCKRFGGIVVADQVDLEIGRGEILGLIGPNGAGKTSLFNLISGVHLPDAGTIRVDGAEVARIPVHGRARRGVARTWQNTRLFASLSVLDNLLLAPRRYPGESLAWLALHPRRLREAEHAAREQALAILARMGLSAAADTGVADLPYGQQKLVGLARALMNDGGLLLLDEPMAGVEGQAYETMKAIVRQEAAAGRAVCVVEHNVSFIRDLCDNAVFMNRGRILERGPVAQLLASSTLTELYFGA